MTHSSRVFDEGIAIAISRAIARGLSPHEAAVHVANCTMRVGVLNNLRPRVIDQMLQRVTAVAANLTATTV
jgi:hypothetical protein